MNLPANKPPDKDTPRPPFNGEALDVPTLLRACRPSTENESALPVGISKATQTSQTAASRRLT